MQNKLILGLGVLILIGIGVWYSADKQSASTPSEITKVKIANLPVIQGLPLYVAVDKGYFAEAGIEVEIVKFEAPNQIIDAIMTGQVDFTSPSGALGITGIADFKNPGKLKVYAVAGGTKGNSGANLIIPNESTLSTLADLKGKKLGILAGTIQWKTIAREILEKNGLNMDSDLTIVELAPSVQVEALASGQVDALLALEPIPTIATNKSTAKIWIADPTVLYISDPSWLGAGIVSVDFAEKNPDTTKKVIAVLERAMAEIKENPDAYRQHLKGHTSLTDELITKVPIVDFKTCGQLTEQDKDSMQKFFDIFTKHKVVEGQINVDGVLYCK